MSRQSLKWLAIVSALFILGALLAACGPAATPQTIVQKETVVVEKTVIVEVPKEVVVTATPVPKPAEAKIILRVGTGDSGEGLNPHQEIIARFEEANPDILVQLEAVAGRDYYARLLTQIAADNTPNIMQIGDDAVPMFINKDAFLELRPFISGDYPLDLNIYLPSVLAPDQ